MGSAVTVADTARRANRPQRSDDCILVRDRPSSVGGCERDYEMERVSYEAI